MLPLNELFPFVSVGRTGTGAEETIPHGLGLGNPDFVEIMTRSNGTFSQGTHAAGNLKITVQNGVVYDLVAGWKSR